MLDGLLIGTGTYDGAGTLLASQQSTWEMLQEVASDPVDPGAPPIRLHGGWIAQILTVTMSDGVSRTRTTAFAPPGLGAPYTGRPAAITAQSYGGGGSLETFVRAFQHGVEVDSALRAVSMRSTPAQTTTTVQEGSGGPVVVKSSASTFSLWPSGAAAGVMAPAKEESFALLDPAAPALSYSACTPGTIPGGWLLRGRVTARTLRGQIQASEDASGTVTSVIFSADLAFAVAPVSNAGLGAAAHLGFEPHEDMTALESVQKAATRPEAYLCCGVAGFFITAGFSVWAWTRCSAMARPEPAGARWSLALRTAPPRGEARLGRSRGWRARR